MRPRVLILTPYYYPVIGGVESNAERFARFLVANGISTQVLTKRLATALPDSEVRHNVPILRIGPHGERSAAGKWRMLPAVYSWLVSNAASYDVVCVVDYRGVGIAAILARGRTGKRVLIQGQTTGVLSGTVGGAGNTEGALTRLVKWPLRRVYARADALAAISRVLQQEALDFGMPADRVHLLPNAIDMTRFAPLPADERRRRRAELGFADDHVVCTYVGRLSREKGVLELVEAWKDVQPANATLMLAGPDMPGSPWDAGPGARSFVEAHNLASSVRFLGPTDDVASVLQVSDVAVQPSHFEALGLASIEALACGLPVVASRVGGLPDFVTDGENGYLVPVKDSPALASALSSLVCDTDTRARMSANARASVSVYDERTVFGRMLDVLTTLASR
ncbi:MAG: glycosyltransferase family 4 protein [Vicinamibacterales bacterium]